MIRKIKDWFYGQMHGRFGNGLRKCLSRLLKADIPRPMQVEAWRKWKKGDGRHKLLAANQGWGKSYMIMMVALHEQMFEKGRRNLIITPRKNITSNYVSADVWVFERDWVGVVYFLTVAAMAFVSLWLVVPIFLLGLPIWRKLSKHRLEIVNLGGCNSIGTVSQVKEYILRGDNGLACCSMSASRAWQELTSEHGEKLIGMVGGLTLWFDECHMAKGGEQRNSLGDFMFDMIRGDESVRPGLVSGTPFREDGDMVHRDDVWRFEGNNRYECPFDRHFEENMTSVEYMEYDYIGYDGVGGWQDDLTEYVQDKGKRMLVFIPGVNSLTSSGKNNDYALAEAAIRKVYPNADIVNLVDDLVNTERLDRLRKDLSKKDGYNPDFVIALRMFMLGSDWPDLRSEFDLAPSKSLSTDAQKVGRLHRNGKDKETISNVVAFMRFGRIDIDNMHEQCKHRLNAVISVLLMQYIFVGEAMYSESRGGGGNGNGRTRRNPAMDWPELHLFIRNLYGRLSVGDTIDDCIAIARDIMDKMNVPDELRNGLDDIVRHIQGRDLSRRTAKALVENGCDPLGMSRLTAAMSLQFSTGKVGAGIHEDFRQSLANICQGDVAQLRRAELLRVCVDEIGWESINHTTLDAEGEKIGMWLSTQRGKKRNGELSKTVEERLNDILGMSWEMHTSGMEWAKLYVECRSKQDITGKTVYRGKKIGAWINNVRAYYQSNVESKRNIAVEEYLTANGVRLEHGNIGLEREGLKCADAIRRVIDAGRDIESITHKEEMDGLPVGTWLRRARYTLTGRPGRKLSPEEEKAALSLPGFTLEKELAQRKGLMKVRLVRKWLDEGHTMDEMTHHTKYQGVLIGEVFGHIKQGKLKPCDELQRELDDLGWVNPGKLADIVADKKRKQAEAIISWVRAGNSFDYKTRIEGPAGSFKPSSFINGLRRRPDPDIERMLAEGGISLEKRKSGIPKNPQAPHSRYR